MQVQPVITARLLDGAEQLKGNNVNPTYRAQILANDGSIKAAFVKDLVTRELGTELLVGSLGKLLGLRIPNCYLVISDKVLPTNVGPTLHNGERLLFASEDAATPPLGQLINPSGSNYIDLLRRLAAEPEISTLFAFDTWTANVDRHPWNLLFAGTALWLIDHGQCLGGPTVAVAALAADFSYPQKITTSIAAVMNDEQKQAVVKKCGMFPTECTGVNARKLLSRNFIERILGSSDFDRIADFLEERIVFVPKLGAKLVGVEMVV